MLFRSRTRSFPASCRVYKCPIMRSFMIDLSDLKSGLPAIAISLMGHCSGILPHRARCCEMPLKSLTICCVMSVVATTTDSTLSLRAMVVVVEAGEFDATVLNVSSLFGALQLVVKTTMGIP